MCTCHPVFFCKSCPTVTTGGHTESSTTAKEGKELWKQRQLHTVVHMQLQRQTRHNSSVSARETETYNPTCVWPEARVTGHRIPRCFLLSCSTDLGTRVSITHSSARTLKRWPHDSPVVFSGQDSLRLTSKMTTPYFYGFKGKFQHPLGMTPLTIFLS